MRLLIVTLAALPISAATAEPAIVVPNSPQMARLVQIDPATLCPRLAATDDPQRAEFKKLNELPPADAFHAVLRVDSKGCLDPVMVGYQYGRRR